MLGQLDPLGESGQFGGDDVRGAGAQLGNRGCDGCGTARDEELGEGFALIARGNRLSILPVTAAQWKFLLSLE